MYNLDNKLISLSIIHVFIHTIYHSKKPLGKGVVSLLWYKTISANLYKLQLDGQLWCKSIPSLTHLHPSRQNRPGAYSQSHCKRLATFQRLWPLHCDKESRAFFTQGSGVFSD